MSSNIYHQITVIGVNSEAGPQEIEEAREYAVTLFEEGLVSELTPVGHNFIQSFCVFPTGSSEGRDPQLAHARAILHFCEWLKGQNLEFVAISWREREMPIVTYTQDGPVV